MNQKDNIKVIPTLTIIALIGLSGYLLIERQSAKDTPEPTNPPAQTQDNPITSQETQQAFRSEPIEMDLLDWQVHKNEKYGYAFEYPTSWELSVTHDEFEHEDLLTSHTLGTTDTDIKIVLGVSEKIDVGVGYYGDWKTVARDNFMSAAGEDIILNGMPALTALKGSAYDNVLYYYLEMVSLPFPQQDRIVEISLDVDSLEDIAIIKPYYGEIYARIVNSFRFL